MLTSDQIHELRATLTVIATRTALEQRRLRRGDVDCARTTAVREEITSRVQDLAGQIERLDGRAVDAVPSKIRILVAD